MCMAGKRCSSFSGLVSGLNLTSRHREDKHHNMEKGIRTGFPTLESSSKEWLRALSGCEVQDEEEEDGDSRVLHPTPN